MSQINEELISILKLRTPIKEKTVDLLMDIIPMGKEAAYRRLRGEIPFTLEEAIVICKQFNISLDTLIGVKEENTYAFHMNPIYSENSMEEYNKLINQIGQSLEYVKDIPGSFSRRAYRTMPNEFLFKYESLSIIYIYVLYYQLYMQATPKKIMEIGIPKEIFITQRKISKLTYQVDSILILDKRVFFDFLEIVQYFYGLGVVSDEDMAQIKGDMHKLVDDIKQCASSGLSPEKKKLDMYISHISFDCTYTHLECSEFNACSVGVYCIDHLSCSTSDVCEKHKLWIKSLIRFSSLISVSGELQRNEFFSKQHELIDSML